MCALHSVQCVQCKVCSVTSMTAVDNGPIWCGGLGGQIKEMTDAAIRRGRGMVVK